MPLSSTLAKLYPPTTTNLPFCSNWCSFAWQSAVVGEQLRGNTNINSITLIHTPELLEPSLHPTKRAVLYPKMEIAAALVLLLVTVVTADSPFCEPTEVVGRRSTWISAERNMGPGCWSSFSNQSRDVHVLNLPHTGIFSVNLTAARPADLIIGCLGNTQVLLIENNNVTVYSTSKCTIYGKKAVPLVAEDFLTWAKETLGGVTSFTTVTDPQGITFTGHTVPRGGSVECTPKGSFFPEDYLHIVNIPEGVEIQHVSVRVVSQKKTTLFLRGPEGTKWTIEDRPNDIGFSSNNQVLLHGYLVPPMLHSVQDSAESFQKEVLLKAGTGFITSYTEIRGGGSSLRLLIGTGDRPASEAQTTAAELGASPTPHSPQPHPLLFQLFDTPECHTPLGPSAQIQPGRRAYGNISSQSGPFLTFGVTGCRVRSRSSCLELLFKTERCSPSSCLISLNFPLIQDQPQDQPSTSWVLECTVQYCSDVRGQTVCVDEGSVHSNVEVLRSSSEPCLDFDLSAVLGVAFGGFLIGILLTGALWFIQVRTGRSHSVTKHLPVPTNPASCGDSSASPSIGSTKSTPTSSMA
ncbi:hypothetical protein SKAU_G00005270 [Synaphobranchus kaupii]|uniref:TGFBR3/Endoglin-like N-terminal domain-containing protein n=1 Tax=Synaphobranchus kaupii TaxID=118154 RepID=A0A9Q1GA53_SYNKA|nr:hypothetical protein SKAU_G00005270 [Synaphobranchus kaupii]